MEPDFSSFPKQEGFKVSIDDAPRNTEHGEIDGDHDLETSQLACTNDVMVVLWRGGEGDVVPWHTHVSELDQFFVVLEGAIEAAYRDNDGDPHSTEVVPGEVCYLPRGAYNQIEVVSGPAEWLDFQPRVSIFRPDFRLTESVDEANEDRLYDPLDVDHVALDYDSLRGVINQMDETSVTRW
jgi:quercetin dioxygenase-like cupin family protein